MITHIRLKKFLIRTGLIGTLTAISAVVLMGILFYIISRQGTEPQPSAHTLTLSEIITALEKARELRTLFLSIDIVFILSYLLVFTGLFILASARWFVMALAGLLFAFCAGGADLFENVQLLRYMFAEQPINQSEWFLLVNTFSVKWVASGAALICFALAWPWKGYAFEKTGLIEIPRKNFRLAGAAMCVFAVAAFAAGFLAENWLSIAALLFIPNLYFMARVFHGVLK
jgi:hypothetical protein